MTIPTTAFEFTVATLGHDFFVHPRFVHTAHQAHFSPWEAAADALGVSGPAEVDDEIIFTDLSSCESLRVCGDFAGEARLFTAEGVPGWVVKVEGDKYRCAHQCEIDSLDRNWVRGWLA